MSDFDHDLYGDLDLEDLDATQLDEELVDPDLETPANDSSAPAAANEYKHEPPAAQQPPADHGAGPSSGGGDHQQQQQFPGQFGNQGPHGGHGGPGFDDRMKPSDMPDEGKMFIGGLNWETTDDRLRSYFTKYGDIDNCTIMRDPTGRSRGFAFLTFKDPASVQLVLDTDHQLDGKMIDPKRAIPRAEHERTAKVFVGGLAPSVTSEALKRFLQQFGKVMDATVMFDRMNGRSKGFAFATFAEESGVDNAMSHSGIELEGRQIEIKKAQPRGPGTQVKNFTGPGGQQGGGRTSFNATSGAMGGFGMGGFDPSVMAMMYQNMMKNSAGGGGMGMAGGQAAGGFDPSNMAMMYQNMMKNMGMGQAPAINPNMARGGMGGMAMGGMNPMGMMGMGAMGGMGMGMGGMNMGMNNMGNMGGMNGGGMGGNGGGGRGGRQVPNAPRGPAAMRQGGGPSGMAQPMAQGGSNGGNNGNGNGGAAGATGAAGSGSGPQRYSTQGSQRAKPY